MKKNYYIAYGSNLNTAQMKKRCPNARVFGTAMLDGWELLFRGSYTGAYLTIEQNAAENTPVAVWEISKKDEKALDRYEGYPAFYYKRFFTLEVTLGNGEKTTVRAFAYIMHEDRPLGVPTKYYLKTCYGGYCDFGFNDLPLRAAYEKVWRCAIMENNAAQERVCPLCGQAFWERPALSRADNKTLICPDCGVREALQSIGGIDKDEQEKILDIIHRHTSG